MTDNSSHEDVRRKIMCANEYFNPSAATNYQHLLPAQYFTQQMYYPYVNPYSHLTEANGSMAIHGYGSDGRPKFRRRRTIFNPEQLDVLEQYFEKYKYPDVKRRKIISEEIGLPEERIQIWFQNRQAKDKRQTEQQVKLQKLVNEAIGTSQEATSLRRSEPAQSGPSVTKTISTPVNASRVIMWFKHWSYYGGYKYDSNYGSNYQFEITVPSIVFEADWNENVNVNGKLKAGGNFEVFYDTKRLKVGAKIVAGMKFENEGKVIDVDLESDDHTSYDTAEISIPDDAEMVEMWFYYEDENGKKQYDSDYGQNYRFKLSE